MLIFDEADHLYGWDVKKFEIIRQLWDETNTPIVLVGPPRLEEILTHGSGRSNLSQLYRRKYEIKLTGIKPDEVRAILAQYDVEPRVAAELTLSVGLSFLPGLSLARNSDANGFFMESSCCYSPFPVFRSWQLLQRGCQLFSSQKRLRSPR